MSDRKDQVSRQKNKPEKNRNCQIFFRIGNCLHQGFFFYFSINQKSVASSVIQATGNTNCPPRFKITFDQIPQVETFEGGEKIYCLDSQGLGNQIFPRGKTAP